MGNTGYISAITVAELSAGAFLSPLRDAVCETIELLAHVLKLLGPLKSIALEGGKIYAILSKAGTKIEFNDCLIAATARSLGMNDIVTRNRSLQPDHRVCRNCS